MPDFFSPQPVQPLGKSLLGSPVPQERQPPAANPISVPPVVVATPNMRKFGDIPSIRKMTFDRVLNAVQTLPPVSNQTHTLRISNPHYSGPESFSLDEEKQAILGGRDLTRPLKGTWELLDNATGQVVDRKSGILAHVPYYSQRGTFIIGGNNYSLAHQMRLRSGVFTRQKANGELEAHVNVMPGKGHSHRIFLDPETGIFRLQVGQARIPLVTALKAMGVPPSQIQQQWGELAGVNLQKDDAANLSKLYTHFARKPEPGATPENKQQAIAAALQAMELDPEVTQRTLGQGFTHITPDALFATTKKLLAVSRLEQQPDDRDAMAYQTVLGPEDLLSERVSKAQGHLRTALWKATQRKNLQRLQTGLFTKPLMDAIMASGLGQPGEEINPLQVADQYGRVSRMGVGGIPSLDAIPEEARSVQASHFGFIDPVVTPESSRVGVDSRFASTVQKGADGRVYAQFRDVKNNALVWKSAQDMSEASIAFPGELQSPRKYVRAMVNGQLKFVARDQVDYELPNFESAFSMTSNMVPLKSAMKGQRAAMAQRMLTQALPLLRAEAPLVQNGTPDSDDSYEERYAANLGAVRATKPGMVAEVKDNAVTVRYTDGTTEKFDLYQNFPNNRKTALHQTPVVQVGQPFQPGQLLAKSNYTDGKGVSALGLNARVAYVPWKGENFEDAISITESFAKRIASEHLYQHELKKEEGLKTGLGHFIGAFPGRYDRRQIDTMDDDGVVKVGTKVHEGDPLVLGVKKRDRTAYTLHQARNAFTDASQTWEHHAPGVVTDVVKTPKGSLVTVKTQMEAQVGDKLCYDPETRLLTRTRGWVYVADVRHTDELATMNPETEELEWQFPTHLHSFYHEGEMYKLVTKQLDMLVTPNHDLWVAKPGQKYQAMQARDFYAAKGEWQFRRDVRQPGSTDCIVPCVDTAQFHISPPVRPIWDRASNYPEDEEAMVPYSGPVYCVTVPNHILIVERRTKTYLSLNSGRYG